jgi:TRAP transporter TAXI family solute receptor
MTSYVLAIALADIINENSAWLRATAIESPNLTSNFQLLINEPERRANTLIVSVPSHHVLASEGREPFTTQYDGLRFIATTACNAMSFITLDPNIKTVADLKGKRVSVGAKSSVTVVEEFQTVLELAGVLDEVDLEYLGFSEGVDALRDGLIDAAIGTVNLTSPGQYAPSPNISEIMATKTIYFISLDSEDITHMLEITGLLDTEHIVPAGSLGETQTEPWITLGAVTGWAADKEMPDDVVYEICRIIYENADKFQEYSPSLGFISHETMADWGLPEEDIHPGALQFYKDKGMEIGS